MKGVVSFIDVVSLVGDAKKLALIRIKRHEPSVPLNLQDIKAFFKTGDIILQASKSTKEICPRGPQKWGENNGPSRTDSTDYRPRLRPRPRKSTSSMKDKVCWCGKVFSSMKGIRIYQTRMRCSAIPSPAEDQQLPPSNTDLPDPVHRSEGSHQPPGETEDSQGQVSNHNSTVDSAQPCGEEVIEGWKAKIQWPAMAEEREWCEFDEDITSILENNLKGTSKRKLEVMGDMIYNLGESRCGILEKKKKQALKEPSRRQREIKRLRQELRSLRKRWKKADVDEKEGLAELRDQVRKKLGFLRRAEYQRRKKKEKERQRKPFFKNPYQFTKGLFSQSKNGELQVSKEVLEEHLRKTYSDESRSRPMPE